MESLNDLELGGYTPGTGLNLLIFLLKRLGRLVDGGSIVQARLVQ